MWRKYSLREQERERDSRQTRRVWRDLGRAGKDLGKASRRKERNQTGN